jgi:uncharacterized protein (TIGR01777 family)
VILVTGASGLVGTELVRSLRAQGRKVMKLVRRQPASEIAALAENAKRDSLDQVELVMALEEALDIDIPKDEVEQIRTVQDAVNYINKKSFAPDEVGWNIDGTLALPAGATLDSVVHLAGEPVVGLWTAAKKRAIRESRVLGTRKLSEALAAMPQPPATLICASAVGYYGSRGSETLTEASGPGGGFLAETSVAWEAAAQAARDAGIRVVNLRIGIVLTAKGGALPAMAAPFKLGVGAQLGNGRHWVPWISLPDLVRLIEFAITHEEVSGPVNAVSPNPVTNAQLSREIANAVHRWMLPMGIPAFALRMLPGGIADEALLASAKVLPARAQQLGFSFESPDLPQLLSRELAVSTK